MMLPNYKIVEFAGGRSTIFGEAETEKGSLRPSPEGMSTMPSPRRAGRGFRGILKTLYGIGI